MEVKVPKRAVSVLECVGSHGDVSPVPGGEQLPTHPNVLLPPVSVTHVKPGHTHHAVKAWNQHGCHRYILMVFINPETSGGHPRPFN